MNVEVVLNVAKELRQDGTASAWLYRLSAELESACRCDAEPVVFGDWWLSQPEDLRKAWGSQSIPAATAAFNAGKLYTSPQIPEGWRPIETAPKDGSKILAIDDGEHVVTRWTTWRDGFGETITGWQSQDSGELGPDRIQPSLWMPLPPPPQPALAAAPEVES